MADEPAIPTPDSARDAARGDRPAADDGGRPEAGAPRYRGWYWFGIVLQVLVWALIWLGIAVAIGVGGKLTEFRYVGF